jgi:hypothetical protein
MYVQITLSTLSQKRLEHKRSVRCNATSKRVPWYSYSYMCTNTMVRTCVRTRVPGSPGTTDIDNTRVRTRVPGTRSTRMPLVVLYAHVLACTMQLYAIVVCVYVCVCVCVRTVGQRNPTHMSGCAIAVPPPVSSKWWLHSVRTSAMVRMHVLEQAKHSSHGDGVATDKPCGSWSFSQSWRLQCPGLRACRSTYRPCMYS